MPILSWLKRDEDVRAVRKVPYRLLEEAPDLSAGDADTANMLIHGDNLEALKALLPFYAGRVKCIYIDPPYNTRSAFEQYDDNLEHSQWLAMMWPRLELLRDLLSEDGSIWVQLDDNEAHYARVILDEIFGRKNFVADVTWQKSYAVRSNAEFVSSSTEHILWYCKSRAQFKPNMFPRSDEQTGRFSNPDNDRRGPWQSITFTISLMAGARGRQFARTGVSPNIFEVTSPSGRKFMPPPGRCWARSEIAFKEMDADNRIWWGPNGDRTPRLKMFLGEAEEGVIPTTLWASGEEFGFNQDGIRELRALELNFSTPKPERLISRVLHLASNPDDLVLDSFLGSGTTAAVAQKMGRRYIGIEAGDQAVELCAPRLQKVIAGEQGGISEAVGWQGGGGFRFYRLGPPVFDEAGHIRTDIKFPVLAAHVWFSETNVPWRGKGKSPLLGIHDGRAYALLYNGILGDKRPEFGNVLTRATLEIIKEKIAKKDPAFKGSMTVYGELSRLAPGTLDRMGIIFKQTPYDIKARA
jgi:adenine-specific DNA-methyltransferase